MPEITAPQVEIDRLRATGRNDDCPCGSKKKYKKCHLRDDEEKERAYLASVNEANQKAAQAKEHEEGCEDPDCEEDHGKAAVKKAPKKAAAAVSSRPAPKGPSGASVANAQRSMPRKAN